MKRSQLIDEIAEAVGISRRDAERVLLTVAAIVWETLRKRGAVTLERFGTFSIHPKGKTPPITFGKRLSRRNFIDFTATATSEADARRNGAFFLKVALLSSSAAEAAGLDQKVAARAVEVLAFAFQETSQSGEAIVLPGLGTFKALPAGRDGEWRMRRQSSVRPGARFSVGRGTVIRGKRSADEGRRSSNSARSGPSGPEGETDTPPPSSPFPPKK